MLRVVSWSFIFVCVSVCLFSCSGDSPTQPEHIIEFVEIDDVLANPFKGFVPEVGRVNPVYQEKLQSKTYTWRALEPTKGVYDWAQLERNWGDVKVSGRQVGFRITAALPGETGHFDIPEWLVAEGVRMRAYRIDGMAGLAPDWDDPKFLQAHQDFIQALGAQYDSDPRVAWIDIGSYGFWGEWHLFANDSLAGTQAAKRAILQAYFDAFPTKSKVIAFDDIFATQYVVERGGGVRFDCLGTMEENNYYMTRLDQFHPGVRENLWKTALMIGEFCGSAPGATDGTTLRFDLNLQFIKENHWSFIGPAGGDLRPVDDQHRENLDLLHKTLGYRFVLKSMKFKEVAERGSSQQIEISVENRGVAPFYFDWPLQYYLTDSNAAVVFESRLDVDIRTWLPGVQTTLASVMLPTELPAGTYDIKIALLDPATNQPGIMFANEGRDAAGRYMVSPLLVK